MKEEIVVVKTEAKRTTRLRRLLVNPKSEDEMQHICATLRGTVPVLSNQIEGGRTPMPGIRKLEEMGYALALFPLGTAFAAAKGMKEYLEVLATEGDTRGAMQRMILFEEFNHLIGLDEHTHLEKRYQVAPAVE
ncbi:MAG: 2,3-dimethylmalate lyase [Verrucomicrobiota bacterium]|jgi:2-methylisocitrate lyase-like PEP mutase family enzyme